MDTAPLRESLRRIGTWTNLPFFSNGQFDAVCTCLEAETRQVFPDAGNIFKAFQMVDRQAVRVVILGQDPYPTPGNATGLAFAVSACSNDLPGSLQNVFKEVKSDLGGLSERTQPDLLSWARQGVLLLNTTLTVPEEDSGGHLCSGCFGWCPLIKQALAVLAPRRDIAWLLWGDKAHKMEPSNMNANALVIKTSHPSQRSASRTDSPFLGSRPFSRANQFLACRERQNIIW